MLLPFRIHRAGSVSGATAAAGSPSTTPSGGVSEARVLELLAEHAGQPNAHHTPPVVPARPMPASPAEAAAGTSTAIRSWTAKLIRAAIEAVVSATPSGGGSGPADLDTYDLTFTTAEVNTFVATGITLPTDKTWLYVSFGAHTERQAIQGTPATVTAYAPGPWERVLIQDLIDLPDVWAGGLRTDANAMEFGDVQAQNFRNLEIGAASDRVVMITITSLNQDVTIAGPLRFKVD